MGDTRRLVITRSPGESFLLVDSAGVGIEVTLAELRGRKARIRIEAPPSIKVVRDDAIVADPSGMVGRRIQT